MDEGARSAVCFPGSAGHGQGIVHMDMGRGLFAAGTQENYCIPVDCHSIKSLFA